MRIPAAITGAVLLLIGLTVQADPADLLAGYARVRGQMGEGPLGIPIHVQADGRGEARAATVYGLLEQPYSAVRGILTEASDWCGFLPLNQNVKACTWQEAGDTATVALYVGRKYYQTPRQALRVAGTLAVEHDGARYTRVVLHADEGPLGTADYRIVVEAAPRAGGTLLRLQWSYRSSWRSRLATETYLATLGRDKIGFTVVGREPDGAPRFVGGVDGMIERNAVRYYLALEAYLQTAGLPSGERLAAARESWYAATERYPRQLRELSRREYLESKAREFGNQARLQRALAETAGPLAQAGVR